MPSIASTKGSKLWADLERVIAETARPAIDAKTLDRSACMAVVAMGEALGGGPIDPKSASDAAKRIVGCYRARDFIDVDTFVVALVATLAQHPAVVVRMVADPLSGIPRKYKFAPAISEIADELEATGKRIRLAASGARRALSVSSLATQH